MAKAKVEIVALAKGPEKALERAVDREKALAKVQVKAAVTAKDRAKVLERVAVAVKAKAKDKVKVNKAKVNKGLRPENVKNVMVAGRIFPTLPKIVLIVMAPENHQKIILKTLWRIS